MKLVTRPKWGARSRGATTHSHPIGPTKGIVSHWNGPRMGITQHSQCASRVRGIERYHRDTRGWADIAYNALVCPHGYVFVGRGPGVKSAANGNTQTNRDYYAVCYLGGEGDPFTDDGKRAMRDAFSWLSREGSKVGAARIGHRDLKSTTCPGAVIYSWVRSGTPLPRVPAKPVPKGPTTRGERIDIGLRHSTAAIKRFRVARDSASKRGFKARASRLTRAIRGIRAGRKAAREIKRSPK